MHWYRDIEDLKQTRNHYFSNFDEYCNTKSNVPNLKRLNTCEASFPVWVLRCEVSWNVIFLRIISLFCGIHLHTCFLLPMITAVSRQCRSIVLLWKETSLQILCHSFLPHKSVNGTHRETNHKLTTSVCAAVVLSITLNTANFLAFTLACKLVSSQFSCQNWKSKTLKKMNNWKINMQISQY